MEMNINGYYLCNFVSVRMNNKTTVIHEKLALLQMFSNK